MDKFNTASTLARSYKLDTPFQTDPTLNLIFLLRKILIPKDDIGNIILIADVGMIVIIFTFSLWKFCHIIIMIQFFGHKYLQVLNNFLYG